MNFQAALEKAFRKKCWNVNQLDKLIKEYEHFTFMKCKDMGRIDAQPIMDKIFMLSYESKIRYVRSILDDSFFITSEVKKHLLKNHVNYFSFFSKNWENQYAGLYFYADIRASENDGERRKFIKNVTLFLSPKELSEISNQIISILRANIVETDDNYYLIGEFGKLQNTSRKLKILLGEFESSRS